MSEKKNKAYGMFAFHPVLFALYPVLALYLVNISEVNVSAVYKALITSLIILLGVALVSWMAVRPWNKSAMVASWAIILFFYYGHVLNVLSGTVIAHHRYLGPLWVLICLAGIVWIMKTRNDSDATKVFNWVSLVLIISVSLQILFHWTRQHIYLSSIGTEEARSDKELVDTTNRDVYYILLDAYGRQDLLMQEYDTDISGFVEELEEMGFYFPNCTQSNYTYTTASMTATLNMEYLDNLGIKFSGEQSETRGLLRYSMVRSRFESLGYSTVTFRSIFPWIDIKDSTYYFDYFANESNMSELSTLNFQYLFLRTTAIRPLLQWLENNPQIRISSFWAGWIPVSNTLESREYKHYQQSSYALNMLETIPDLPGKQFVYAHLFVTHQPFVFLPDGNFAPFLPQTYAAYRDQIVFVNGRLVTIIKNILERSDPEPIIIIQGDHSYSEGEDRVRILNAYYFPENGNINLYDTITPVNSFRILFNTYYGGDYKLLPDVSWYAEGSKKLASDDQADFTISEIKWFRAPISCIDGSVP
ncbi:MAG TPA: sulfatase-like hydrolase/transferase [Anaerolineales bacterium]